MYILLLSLSQTYICKCLQVDCRLVKTCGELHSWLNQFLYFALFQNNSKTMYLCYYFKIIQWGMIISTWSVAPYVYTSLQSTRKQLPTVGLGQATNCYAFLIFIFMAWMRYQVDIFTSQKWTADSKEHLLLSMDLYLSQNKNARYIYIYMYIYIYIYTYTWAGRVAIQFSGCKVYAKLMSCVPILKENTIHKPIDFDAHFYREAELTKQIDAQKIEMKLQCERYEKKIQVRFQNRVFSILLGFICTWPHPHYLME